MKKRVQMKGREKMNVPIWKMKMKIPVKMKHKQILRWLLNGKRMSNQVIYSIDNDYWVDYSISLAIKYQFGKAFCRYCSIYKIKDKNKDCWHNGYMVCICFQC